MKGHVRTGVVELMILGTGNTFEREVMEGNHFYSS